MKYLGQVESLSGQGRREEEGERVCLDGCPRNWW